MWMYTGKGDEGTTSLFDGMKISKDDPRLKLIGTLDELNAFIGLAISSIKDSNLTTELHSMQLDISKTMGLIAGAKSTTLIDFDLSTSLSLLEEKITHYSKELDNPKKLTFPGKTQIGALFDVCRVVARRSERYAVGISKGKQELPNNMLAYLNRLSSYFYVLRLFFDKNY